MYIDDRWLYEQCGAVPVELYEVPIGSAAVRRAGGDVTIVAVSYMVAQAVDAAAELQKRGISAEVIDLRSIKPWDKQTVFASVAKTGSLIAVDAAWPTCSVASEVIATVATEMFQSLKAAPLRVCLPDAPAPMSAPLERAYYIGARDIVAAVNQVLALEERS
jgi:pyruvate dehydrogenase E1 component beta subunit